ncbi:DUF1127 domain-containing protein [Pelagibacterium luteolum]|uniref:YjiS-like domain-containing protein n=1 Tax=Pelagibacterium luteolum TaxID=440168 RepID=A0A1G7VUW7_9HYPH|nr:DUF1127 domain-containing protein [Pelagibacterium luteolum]SDG63584.1 protein of unknown function [Pelagibacterium luteolum]
MTVFNRDEFWDERTGAWQLARQLVASWYRGLRARRERRDALIYMSEMADWQLKDIGLHRGDVHRLIGREKIMQDRVERIQPH